MDFGLITLLPHLPAWALVLFRLAGIFVLAPLFGSKTVPARVKVLWALGLSFCVYPMLLQPGASAAPLPAMAQNLSLWALAPMVAMELMLGLVIGYGASLPIMGMQVAGHLADQQIGLGLAGIYNPQIEEETGVIGEFYFILATMIFLVLGGHRELLRVLLGTFDSVPLGGLVVDTDVVAMLVGVLRAMFELALRVAAPLLCLVFLETVAMGFIARTVPQMNIMTVGFPLRILVGIGVLIAALGTQAGTFAQSLRHMFNDLGMLLGR